MKQLKTEFIGRGQVRGFKFTQIKKNEFAYIYKVEDSNTTWYEIFEHRENKRFDCISYPKNNSFSVWAWTYLSLNRALECFEAATDSVLNRKGLENV